MKNALIEDLHRNVDRLKIENQRIPDLVQLLINMEATVADLRHINELLSNDLHDKKTYFSKVEASLDTARNQMEKKSIELCNTFTLCKDTLI